MLVEVDQLRNAPTAYNYAIAVAADVSGFRLTKGANPKLLSCKTGRWLWLKRKIDFVDDAAWLLAVLEKEQISVSFSQGGWTATCPPNQYAGFPETTTSSFSDLKWAVIGSLIARLGESVELPDDVYAVYLSESAARKEEERLAEDELELTLDELFAMGAFDGKEFQ